MLASFRNIANAAKLRIKCNDYQSLLPASEEHLSMLQTCDATFIDEFLKEMQIQARLGPSRPTSLAKDHDVDGIGHEGFT